MNLYRVFLRRGAEVMDVFVISVNTGNDACAIAQLKNPGWVFTQFQSIPVITEE